MRKGEKFEGVCTKCHDGDSIVVSYLDHTWDIRLFGVDAPEKGQVGFEWSKNVLSSLVLEKFVECTIVRRDRYGRLVCMVLLKDGSDLCEVLLERGAVWYYPHYGKELHYHELFNQSYLEHRGIFSMDPIRPPWVYRKEKEQRAVAKPGRPRGNFLRG